ncbi:NAD kinase 2, mitochondrial isoform 3-T5 [Vipera latastei]
MTCLPGYLSGGNPGATLRALLKSLRRQPPSRRQLSLPRVRLAEPAASFAAAAATAGLPLRCPALAGEGSPSSPTSFPLPSPPPPRRCLGSGGRSNWSSKAGSGFRPSRVVVVAKTTRYEFEQQRYRYAGLSEEDLKQLLALKGSNYSGLLERHRIHTKNVEHIVNSLRNEKIEVRLVKRRDYDEETVRWADAVIAAGGDGTMLLAASKVLDQLKPVIGINTDPDRSEGHLCLPVRYTHSFPDALQKLYSGEFRWQWRQRIRLYLEGTGINPVPVDLHEQQLSQEQHSRAHVNGRFQDQRLLIMKYQLMMVHGRNKRAQVSIYALELDQKLAKSYESLKLPLNKELIQKVTNGYNESLLYSPEEPRLFFSIREPISNRVFSSSRQRGFASKVCIRSRCWDACMVVDGGTSFEFNDGAIASILINTEDALRTVLLED